MHHALCFHWVSVWRGSALTVHFKNVANIGNEGGDPPSVLMFAPCADGASQLQSAIQNHIPVQGTELLPLPLTATKKEIAVVCVYQLPTFCHVLESIKGDEVPPALVSQVKGADGAHPHIHVWFRVNKSLDKPDYKVASTPAPAPSNRHYENGCDPNLIQMHPYSIHTDPYQSIRFGSNPSQSKMPDPFLTAGKE